MADEYDFSFWFYVPKKGAAIFFAVAFLVSTVAHCWQCHHYKYFRVTGIFVLCGLVYVVGFALRALGGSGYDNNLAVFIVSVCLIYMVPPLLALANYHILGRVLTYAPHLSPLPPARVLSTFGLLSLVIEGLNGIGASFSSNPDATPSLITAGNNIMRASLALQLILGAAFLSLAGYFHWKCAREGIGGSRGIGKPLITLYVSVWLLLARTAYRVVEHLGLEGVDRESLEKVPPVVRDEWPFAVFEAGLMLVDMTLWNIRHPRRYLPADPRVHLAPDGVTEVEGPGIEDPRGLAVKILDPFDVVGMFRKRDRLRIKESIDQEAGISLYGVREREDGA